MTTRIDAVRQLWHLQRRNAFTWYRLSHSKPGINAALRDEFGKRTVQEVVSGERAEIMETLAKEANDNAADLGVEGDDPGREDRVEVVGYVDERPRAAKTAAASD